MLCNAKKTCCMIFKPRNNKFVISENFKRLSVNNFELKYVDSFKYLGHIINDKLCDDDDLNRQVRNLYVLCNILLRHYNKCSMRVKKMLYKAFCLYLYSASLWKNATFGASNYFKSCFNRCMKIFFFFIEVMKVSQTCCLLLVFPVLRRPYIMLVCHLNCAGQDL